MNTHKIKAAGALVTLLLLTACGSSGGGLGDIFGGGQSSDAIANEIRGTVDFVDTRDRSITLTNVTNYNNNLNNGGSGSTVRVFYDDRTPVEFQGRTYNVADLERGDQIQVNLSQSNNQLFANSVQVLHDSSGMTSSGGSNTGAYNSSVRGTVRYIDTNRREIGVDQTYGGNTVVVEYDAN